jgi:hypothetical protein
MFRKAHEQNETKTIDNDTKINSSARMKPFTKIRAYAR